MRRLRVRIGSQTPDFTRVCSWEGRYARYEHKIVFFPVLSHWCVSLGGVIPHDSSTNRKIRENQRFLKDLVNTTLYFHESRVPILGTFLLVSRRIHHFSSFKKGPKTRFQHPEIQCRVPSVFWNILKNTVFCSKSSIFSQIAISLILGPLFRENSAKIIPTFWGR